LLYSNESVLNIIGHISLGTKVPGKPGAGKLYAGFDAAGAENVMVMVN
jgi:hypothetical protein